MPESRDPGQIAGTAEVDKALGNAAFHGRFAHGDLASILNTNIQRITAHSADETRSLTQGTGAWAAMGAGPFTTPKEQSR
jgi:hypothetical protein